MATLQDFGKILSEKDESIDLAHACLMIAEDAYPGLEIERYLGEIERMAMRLRGRMPQAHGAEERIVAQVHFVCCVPKIEANSLLLLQAVA